LERNLLDAERFWTPFPVPSVSASHPAFDPASERLRPSADAPARGRVRPELVSHAVEGLARSAVSFAPHLRAATARLLHRYVRMMFHEGELERPNCHEQYDPVSGRAIVALGDDDHQRSWVNDLLLGLVTGIRPHASGVTIDPFPFGLELAEVTGVRARGATLDVRVEGERVIVRLNGSEREGKLGIPMELAL
jgi:hypothetical protein